MGQQSYICKSLEGECYLFESTVYTFTGEGLGKTKNASISIGSSQVHNKLVTSQKNLKYYRYTDKLYLRLSLKHRTRTDSIFRYREVMKMFTHLKNTTPRHFRVL